MLKRTAMTRKTPLTRGGPLPRSPLGRRRPSAPTPRKALGRRRSKGPRVPRPVQELVFVRSGGRCERCGLDVTAGHVSFNYHHRQPAGMGGSKRPDLHCPSNIMLLCGTGTTGCHGSVERDRTLAIAEGFLVRQETNPAGRWVSVASPHARSGYDLVYLGTDGRYEPYEAAA